METTSIENISVKKFLLKIIIWLPITFVAWYFLTPVILFIISLLSKAVLSLVAGHAVLDIEVKDHLIEIITPFLASKEGTGTITFPINAMKYGYGLALFIAMLLATPDKLSSKLQNLYIGFLILIIVQVWGVTFDTLLTLVFKLGRGIADTMGTTAFTREVIALCYQLGYLILPAVTPVLLWFTMYQDQVAKLAPRFSKKQHSPK